MRRLFQFSLKTLLILFTVLAVWLGLHVRAARMQADAVRTIREYGGSVVYDYEFQPGTFKPGRPIGKGDSWVPSWLVRTFGVDFFHSVSGVNLFIKRGHGAFSFIMEGEPPLHVLDSIPNVRALHVFGPPAADVELAHLASLDQLESLVLIGVTELAIEHLGPLKSLTSLSVQSSSVTDESLRVVGTLPHLESLRISSGSISDEGLKYLLGHDRLMCIDLVGDNFPKYQITDSGLMTLAGLLRLKRLRLVHTRVTYSGVDDFKDVRPDVSVDCSWPVFPQP